MKKVVYLLIFSLMVACVSKNEVEIPRRNDSHLIDRVKVSSKEELLELILRGNNNTIKTKNSGFEGLLDPIDPGELEEDPILQVDCREALEYAIEEGQSLDSLCDASVYEIAGYDTLVPNVSFAGLLNKRAEIQVGDTIYKISPMGTYYFHESLLGTFEENYALLEEIANADDSFPEDIEVIEGNENVEPVDIEDDQSEQEEPIPTGEELIPGIFRYNTFKHNSFSSNSSNSNPSSFGYEASGSFHLLNYNWANAIKYSINAKTLLGKLFSSIFGSNKRHNKYIDSKHRLHAGLYYYNYIIYSESGISAKFEAKKGFWTTSNADEMFIGWKNIILKTPYGSSIPSPVKTKMVQPKIVAKNIMQQIPIIKKNGLTVYITDLNLTAQQVKSMVQMTPSQLASFYEQRVNGQVNLNGTLCYQIFTDEGVYTIIVGNGILKANKGKLVQLFHKSWVFSAKDVTPYVTPNLSDVWNAVKSTFNNRSKRVLFAGEAAAACYYNGESVGMIFEKK